MRETLLPLARITRASPVPSTALGCAVTGNGIARDWRLQSRSLREGCKLAKDKTAPKKPRAKAPENETLQLKLARLGNQRVNRALKTMDAVARLVAYKPTDEQSAMIVNSLSSKLTEVKARLSGSKASAGFVLTPVS